MDKAEISESLKKDGGGWVDKDPKENVDEVTEVEEKVHEEDKEVKEVVEEKDIDSTWRPKGMPKDERWEPVELNDDQRKRFNRIYGQMQHEKKVSKELADVNRKLIEKLNSFEERLSQQDNINTDSKIKELKEKRKAALEKGDDDLVMEYTDEIVELKQSQKNRKEPEKIQEKIVVEDNEELDTGTVTELAKWVSETDNTGNFVRPWAMEGHKDYTVAKNMAIAIVEEYPNAEPNQILVELQKRMDRYLGNTKPKAVRAVESAEGADVPRSSKKSVQLSPEQVRVATLLYPEIDKKSAIERYRKSLMEDM